MGACCPASNLARLELAPHSTWRRAESARGRARARPAEARAAPVASPAQDESEVLVLRRKPTADDAEQCALDGEGGGRAMQRGRSCATCVVTAAAAAAPESLMDGRGGPGRDRVQGLRRACRPAPGSQTERPRSQRPAISPQTSPAAAEEARAQRGAPPAASARQGAASAPTEGRRMDWPCRRRFPPLGTAVACPGRRTLRRGRRASRWRASALALWRWRRAGPPAESLPDLT